MRVNVSPEVDVDRLHRGAEVILNEALNVVEVLDREQVNVEYMYTFLGRKGDKAVVVFRSDDAARAVEALAKGGIPTLPEDMIQNL